MTSGRDGASRRIGQTRVYFGGLAREGVGAARGPGRPN
jgi:hypothetical protein